MSSRKYGFRTKALHLGKRKGERAHTPPIYMSASWSACNERELLRGFAGEIPLYLRVGANPTHTYVEKKICGLEGGSAAILRADGMNAVSMSMHGALCRQSPHGVVIGPMYGGTYDLLNSLKANDGYEFTFLAATDPNLPKNIEGAICEKTAFVFGEITTNPTIAVWDVPAVYRAITTKFQRIKTGKPASVAQEKLIAAFKKPVFIVDASFSSPYNFRPIEWGADVVVHSATKYLGGRGAFVAGAIVASKSCIKNNPEYWLKAKNWGIENGGTLGSMEAWMLGQFVEDLPIRMPIHNSNALRLAWFLEGHPAVISVSYPGLESHLQHKLAEKLLVTPKGLPGYGGMLSFRIAGGLEAAKSFLFSITNTSFIKHKPSLGYTKSIVESPWLLSQRTMSDAHKKLFGITEDIIRFSVGLEDIDDIIEAVNSALIMSQRSNKKRL